MYIFQNILYNQFGQEDTVLRKYCSMRVADLGPYFFNGLWVYEYKKYITEIS